MRELERARARRQELAERQDLLLGVVPAQHPALRLAARDAHEHSVLLVEVADEPRVELLGIEAALLPELLGSVLELREVVHPASE